MYLSRADTEFRQRTTIWFQRKAVQERKSDDREEFQACSQACCEQGRSGVKLALREPYGSLAHQLRDFWANKVSTIS